MSRPNIPQLSSRIREEALRLGFSRVGITPVEPLPNEDRFASWLERGFQGEMRYLERQAPKRLDPRLVFGNAKSMLVLAMNYYTGGTVAPTPLKGRISRYSWGEDYHRIIENRLKALLDSIQCLEPSAQGISYADTGPIMEKVWGARTALGWMGKNTNLITRSHGSWFFIGVILLNLELEYDLEEKDFCGNCSRCVEACPTGAIVAPYMLDARLCISYLTIELRGGIPQPLRPLIGNRIFGCDCCQEVCPWNRFAIKTSESGFCAREEDVTPELVSLVRISSDEFKKRFEKSPIRRATRDGFVRNVAVALGNSGKSEAVPALGEALLDSSPLVRAHAAWALGRISDKDSLQILESVRTKEADPSVIEEINSALQKP